MFTRVERPTFSHFRRSQPWTTQITVNILILILLVVVLVIINITSHNTRPSSTRMGGQSDWTKQNNTEYLTSTVYSDKEYFFKHVIALKHSRLVIFKQIFNNNIFIKSDTFCRYQGKSRKSTQNRIENRIDLVK